MLCWTNTLGIQIFAPLTVLGMALCAHAQLSLIYDYTSVHSNACMFSLDTHVSYQAHNQTIIARQWISLLITRTSNAQAGSS